MKINTLNDKTYTIKPIKESPKYLSKVLITNGFYRGFKGKVVSEGRPYFLGCDYDFYLIKFRVPWKIRSKEIYLKVNEFEIIE